jgi:hypothetical protein
LKRRLVAKFTVVLLILCIATAVEWVYSSRYVDCLYYTKQQGRLPWGYDLSTSWGVLSYRGRVQFDWVKDGEIQGRISRFANSNGKTEEYPTNSGPWTWSHLDPGGETMASYLFALLDGFSGGGTAAPREPRHFFLSIGYDHQTGDYPGLGPPQRPVKHMWFITVPYGFFVGLFLLAPAGCLASRFRRHRRSESARCRACGYDLRATPGRCPECGTMNSELV